MTLPSSGHVPLPTDTLVNRYPHHGMLIAAQIGAKVAKGEMTWG
jgi:hypothetical protein